MQHRRDHTGFSLIEVLIATALVGLALSALLAANGTYTRVNDVSLDLATSEFLAEQIHEMTDLQPVANLLSYDNVTYSPPRDLNGQALAGFANFSQRITVQNVNPANLQQVVADGSTDVVRLHVEVMLGGTVLCEVDWLRADNGS